MKLGIISPRILIRRALSTFIASTGVALIVLEESSLLENIEEVERSQADTLILDVCAPHGVEGLPELSRLGLNLKVVALVDDLESESCVCALRLGAWGCLSTRQGPSVFQKALSSIARGERWIPQQVAGETIEDTLKEGNPGKKAYPELTPRESEVLGLLANGFRNKEISSRLSICEETAKSHIKSIYRKLKIKGRRDAAFRYLEYLHRPMARQAIKVVKKGAPSSSIRPRKN